MYESKSKDLRVGIFVSIGAVVLMASIILLGGDKILFKSYNHYFIALKQAEGLGKGSIVSLSGLHVGNVVELTFNKKESRDEYPIIAQIELQADFEDEILTSSVATVKTQGALGDKFIFIKPGQLGDAKVKNGGFINTGNSKDFLDALGERSNDISKIGDVIKELHILLKSVNDEGRAAAISANLKSASEKLDKLLGNADSVIKDLKGKQKGASELKQAVAHLNSILKKVDEGQGSLGALINDSTLHDKIAKFLGEPPRKTYLKPLIRATIKNQVE